jgi:hypothetical protein
VSVDAAMTGNAVGLPSIDAGGDDPVPGERLV